MKSIITATCLLLLSYTGYTQIVLSGKVYDKDTKEALVGVNIFIPGTSLGTSTDVNGAFTLSVSKTADSIEVRYMGYQTEKLPLQQGKTYSIALSPSITTMQEAVVTASRDAQLRSDVSLSIQKLTATTISDAKPTLITELLNKVPGVAMVNLNNEQHMMAIRQPMSTNAYYLYMEDGIPLRPMGVFNHNALIEMNVLSVSNIEVVKGPASSLYGPEAVGGAVNFISQKPTAIPSARAGVQMDNYGYKRVQYGLGGMLTNKLGFYAGGFYAKQENGWMNYSDYTKNSINLRFDYQLASKTKMTLATSYNNYYSQTPGSVDSISFYSRQYTSTSDFSYRKVYSLRTRLSTEHQWNANNTTTLHLFVRDNTIAQNPSYSIRWKTGQPTAKGEVNDNSFTSRGFILQHVLRIHTLNTKVIGGTSLDFSPVTYNAFQVDLNATLRPDGKSVEKYSIAQERPDVLLANYKANLTNAAAYMQVEIKPIEAMAITLGGRFDEMSFTYSNFLDNSDGKKSFQRFTPKLGIAYEINMNTGVYVNYSQGFSPPGLTTIFRKRPNTNPAEFYYNLNAARFTNYEIGGWISLIHNKLDINTALYEMIGENELLNIRQPDNSTDYQSAGKTLHRGIEFSAVYRPTNEWMIRAGGTYALHRFDEFILSTNPTDAVKDVNGKMMPGASAWVSNNEIIYKPAFIKGFRIGIEWQYMSSWYQDQVNRVKYDDKGAFGMRGISALNMRTGYTWKGAEVFINIMNVTNELYAFNATRGNNATNTTTYTPAPPRTIVIGLQYTLSGKK